MSKSKTLGEGKQLSVKLIRSGGALEKFREMVELQGGDPRVIEETRYAAEGGAKSGCTEYARAGYVQAIQCEHVGTACVILGGGRERKEDSIDPAVGFVLHKKVGDAVSPGEPLCTVHYNSAGLGARAKALLLEKFHDRR